ncbi:hypothetical protein [Capnocytophaga canimorsus]|uniref:hypothetical protein n=1 Tax=Capnocytophaga canimorsus TaxID=28188 RepID=UPI001EDFB74C|nr:hypothetical protein [Capnocytophaga canimorsus]
MKDNFWGIFLPVSAEISQSFIVKNPEIKNKVWVEISTKGLTLGRANSPEGSLTYFLGKKKENNLVFSSMNAPEIAMFPIYGAFNTSSSICQVVRIKKTIDVGFFIGKINAFTPSTQIKARQLEELTQSILYRDRKKHLLSQQKTN